MNSKLPPVISLRVKLLFGFSVAFSVVFAGAFYWFYTFSTQEALDRLKADMRSTLLGAAAGVNTEELLELYEEGQPNAQGFSDDPRYQRQLAWFETVHSIEPRAWLYSSIVGSSKNNRRLGQTTVSPGALEEIYLVDLWVNYDPSKAVKFLESGIPSLRARQLIDQNRLIEHPKIYTDKWGTWLSASAPLHDDQGNVVAILGLDIEADHVFQVQQAIRQKVLLSFLLTYSILFVIIYVLSGILTRNLTILTQSAEQIAQGDYNQHWPKTTSYFPDELSQLARVFEGMMHSIRTREQLIREGKQVENEMRLALQEEKELSELKSRFISMVSHEFRTPLTVIRTSAELLERYSHIATEEKRQQYFQRIRAAVRNMSHLMEDVLTIGKAEAGKLQFNPTALNLEQFCYDLIEEMKLGTGSDYKFVFACQGLCSAAYLDPKLLRSILSNLLSNAVKYSPQGSIIEFRLVCTQDIVRFSIEDHGIGIPLEDQPYLFELFHRAKNVANIRGTGLGLAIVKQSVDLHQGQINFASREGIGTTFHVQLPLHCPPRVGC